MGLIRSLHPQIRGCSSPRAACIEATGTPEEWDGHLQESSKATGVALSAEAAPAAAGMLSPRGRPEGQGGGW